MDKYEIARKIVSTMDSPMSCNGVRVLSVDEIKEMEEKAKLKIVKMIWKIED